MAKDSRPRNQSHFYSQPEGPTVIEWANPKQQEAFRYGPAPLCISGGFGAAKTYALCLKALYLSDLYPNNRGLIGRKIAKELERTTQATFYKICPQAAYDPRFGGRRADSENYLRLRNGSEILWMHLDDEDIEGVLRGLEINWFILDQAEEIPEELFDMLVSRLGRWDKAVVPPQVLEAYERDNHEPWPWLSPQGKPLVPTYAMLACNPDTYMHWIYRRFHPESTEHRETYKAQGYKMISVSSLENKFLPEQNKALLLKADDSFQRRFVRGEWGIPEGQIHKLDDLSVLEGDPEIVEYIRRNCTLHRALDHGDAAPTCCLWFAVDREGNVFYFREYYMPNKLVSEHRQAITELSRDERYTLNVADPSIFYKTQQKYGGRWSVADEWADISNLPRNTAVFWIAADNNELGTRNRINEYLRVDPERIHPITKEKGSPRLFFVKKSEAWPHGCYHAIMQLKAARHKRIGTDLGKPVFSDERDESVTDHALDPIRYGMASRPPIAITPGRVYGEGSFEAVRQNMLQFKRSPGFRRMLTGRTG